MSAGQKIDVLAVMDAAHGLLGVSCGRELWEARAAVAELIEAAKYVDVTVGEEYPLRPMMIRLRAAIARIAGAA